jgi:hypothetical protein
VLIGHVIESSKDDFYGEKCKDCSRPMRVGDVAMVFDQGRGVFVDRDIIWHRRCVEYALASAPLERDQVEEACQAIVERGISPFSALLSD